MVLELIYLLIGKFDYKHVYIHFLYFYFVAYNPTF